MAANIFDILVQEDRFTITNVYKQKSCRGVIVGKLQSQKKKKKKKIYITETYRENIKAILEQVMEYKLFEKVEGKPFESVVTSKCLVYVSDLTQPEEQLHEFPYLCPVSPDKIDKALAGERAPYLAELFREESRERTYLEQLNNGSGGNLFYYYDKGAPYTIMPAMNLYPISDYDAKSITSLHYDDDGEIMDTGIGKTFLQLSDENKLKQLYKFKFNLFLKDEKIRTINDLANKVDGFESFESLVDLSGKDEWRPELSSEIIRELIMNFYKTNFELAYVDKHKLKIIVSQEDSGYVLFTFYLFPVYDGDEYISFVKYYQTIHLYDVIQILKDGQKVVLYKYFNTNHPQIDDFCEKQIKEREAMIQYKKRKKEKDVHKARLRELLRQQDVRRMKKRGGHKYILKGGGQKFEIKNHYFWSIEQVYCSDILLAKVPFESQSTGEGKGKEEEKDKYYRVILKQKHLMN